MQDEPTVTALALSAPQPTIGDRINHWLGLLAEDMSLAERLAMVRHNKAGLTPPYSREDIDSTIGEYEERIRWYLKKAGVLLPLSPDEAARADAKRRHDLWEWEGSTSTQGDR
jgi:hypothetical protein